MTTSPWKKLRKQHLLTYPECRICGLINKSNHVHHMRYRGKVRGKYEQPGDLVTLCKEHHQKYHKTHKSTGVKLTLEFIELERGIIEKARDREENAKLSNAEFWRKVKLRGDPPPNTKWPIKGG